MKIGFVIGSLEYSGAEKIARYLLKALYERGHEVGVLLLSKTEKYSEFSYVMQFPLLTKGNILQRVMKRQKMIRRIVDTEKYDVVISFGVKFNLDVMEALRGSKTRVILCERNDPYTDPHSKLLRLRRRFVYPLADHFVFQTEQIADFFGRKIKERATIIPNFIEKKQSNVYTDDKDNIIMYTGRLDDRQKNLVMLLRAFSRFSCREEYKLFLIGDGPHRNLLEQTAQNLGINHLVEFTGRQNVYEYLPKAQIYVLPSNYEGMPNSLIEALALGLPCIASRCSGGGAEFLIKDHENGILFDKNDENGLVTALEELSSDSALRCRLSRKAHEVNDLLEFEKIIQLWLNCIESR